MRNITFILCSAFFLMIGCRNKTSDTKQNVIVKIDTIQPYGKSFTASFPGKVKASSDVNLAFRISGTILRIPVEKGTHVKKGQLLAEIDPRDYKIQLAATEAEYNQIKNEAERIIALYNQKSVTPNDYDKAKYGLEQITAKYNAHKNALADTKLTAPFDGYVQSIMYDEDETISAGMPVISLVNTSSPIVEINIPTSDYIRRNDFDSFTCHFDIFPESDFKLDLIGVNQKSNLNQLYNVQLKIKNIGNNVVPTPGMATTVTIQYKSSQQNRMSITTNAVFEKDGKSYIWLYNDQSKTVKLQAVNVQSIMQDGQIILTSGVKPGDVVVTAGVRTLTDGQKVSVLLPASTTNIGGMK